MDYTRIRHFMSSAQTPKRAPGHLSANVKLILLSIFTFLDCAMIGKMIYARERASFNTLARVRSSLCCERHIFFSLRNCRTIVRRRAMKIQLEWNFVDSD